LDTSVLQEEATTIIFQFATRYMQVSITPWLLYSLGKLSRNALDWELSGGQNRSGLVGESNSLCPCENLNCIIQLVACHYTDWAVLTPNP